MWVDPYLFPARGRKLASAKVPYPTLSSGWLIPTFSPQGDGNWVYNIALPYGWLELIPTFSPQGDGNVTLEHPPELLDADKLIPTFSPQGDGNAGGGHAARRHGPRLIPTFSPQGDGNATFRGTTGAPLPSLIPTFSPQGDGNRVF